MLYAPLQDSVRGCVREISVAMFLQIQTDIYTYILLGVLFSNWYMSQIKQELVVIWITFLQSAYPDKVFSYKATENYMELKGKAVWSKDQNGGHV